MKNRRQILRVGFGLVTAVVALSTLPGAVFADSTAPALTTPTGLSISQLKITGDEFVVLQNNTAVAIPDLSSYWLYDFNSVSPLSPGVSSSQQQLPAVSLDAGESLLLSATTRNTCGAEVAGKLSVSLTDGGGFLEIVQLSMGSTGALVQTAGDVVSWSSTASGIIQSVPSSTKDPAGMYYRYKVGTGYSWQLADVDSTVACQLDVVMTAVKQPVSGGLLAPGSEPPSTIISLASASVSGDAGAPSLPVADTGLSAPQITELLPNPDGTGNDDTDEFIELYNANDVPFDLSSFTLQTGSTTKHSYVFPSGTVMPAKSFVAYYSADTGLSLSNTSGMADLLDPFGNTLSQTDAYGTAKDGQSWSLAKGAWYWTSQPTPNAANVVQQITTASKTTSKKSTSSNKSTTTSAVKGASTTAASTSTSNTADATTPAPIHPQVLAAVAALAVGYGVYEYRHDLANRIYQYRTNRAARRSAGK